MTSIRDVHIRVDDQLADAARRGAGLPADVGLAAVIRLALAKLAGWPDAAASYAARISREAGQPVGSNPSSGRSKT